MAAGLAAVPLSPSLPPEPSAAVASRPGAIRRGQLAVLFLYSLVNWSAGNGLLPLLPKFAASLGASDPQIGIYLGISYAAIAVGTLVAGGVADHMGRGRWPMVVVGLAISPLLGLTSLVTAFWQVVVLNAAVWYLAGMALGFASILAGWGAGPGERGRVMGILAVAAPLGSIIGGFGIGPLQDAVGFSTMWIVLGLLYLTCPALGALVREAPRGVRAASVPEVSSRSVTGAAFLVLLTCGLVAAFGSFVAGLGRSLAMQDTYSSSALTSTVAISGLATLPFPWLLGILSDRRGRVGLLALCYAAGAAGLVVYSGAAALWQFWLASALVAFVSYVSTGVGSALVVDLVARPAVGRGLALFNAMGWIGGILGFVVGGYLFPGLGFAAAFLVGAGLLLLALALLPFIVLEIRRWTPSRV